MRAARGTDTCGVEPSHDCLSNKHCNFMHLKKTVLSGLVALLASVLVGQLPPGLDIKAHLDKWSGSREPVPIEVAISRFEAEKMKLPGGAALPTVTSTQVLAAIVRFAADNPKSELAPSLLTGLKSGSLPKGTLIDWSYKPEKEVVLSEVVEVTSFQIDLYAGLHLDKAPMQYDGRWRRIPIAETAIAVTSK